MKHSATTKSIDCVVPLYVNHPSMFPIIQEFLDSLNKDYPKFNKIIVDDDSPIMHNFPFTCRNYTNSGFTRTVNQGLIRTTGDVIIVLNDDLVITPNSLDRFIDLEDDVIASCQDSAGTADDRFGSNFGMTRKTYEKMGLLDEKYKHFYSDREYYDRAIKKGIKVIKWLDIVLPHHESATYKNEDKEKLLQDDLSASSRV